MVNILYYIFIFPLEYMFNFVLNNSISIFGASLAILICSLISQIISYPLQKITLKIEQKEKKLKKEVDSELIHLKKLYKGEELFCKTEEVFKKHHYNPLLSFRASASLFIVIPLFISSFNVLSNNPLFINQRFFSLYPLTSPDQLLFGVNLLPIIMTIFNLYSIYLSTGRLFSKDNMMLLSLSIFFLIYLYNKESALLIYWSTNNILLCLRLLIMKKGERRENNSERS